MKTIRRIFIATFFTVIVGIATVLVCNLLVTGTAEGKLFDNAADIPSNKTGLLLGTSKYLSNGRENWYYRHRIDAAIELYKAGKVKYIVISGDNGRKEYSEPEDMRADLIAAGVDSNAIYLDYAGFRTFDSVVRLREIFGQNKVTVISQRFHNERAVFIASKEGIDAIGYNAKDVNKYYGFYTQMREYLARVKVFVDYITGKEPKFLGEKVLLPE